MIYWIYNLQMAVVFLLINPGIIVASGIGRRNGRLGRSNNCSIAVLVIYQLYCVNHHELSTLHNLHLNEPVTFNDAIVMNCFTGMMSSVVE